MKTEMKTNITEKIRKLAEEHDCSIHVDKDGHIALLRRHYDNEGVQTVRYSPDPCDFHPVGWWESASAAIVENAIA